MGLEPRIGLGLFWVTFCKLGPLWAACVRHLKNAKIVPIAIFFNLVPPRQAARRHPAGALQPHETRGPKIFRHEGLGSNGWDRIQPQTASKKLDMDRRNVRSGENPLLPARREKLGTRGAG